MQEPSINGRASRGDAPIGSLSSIVQFPDLFSFAFPLRLRAFAVQD
jgi:hypothetical protein